MSKNKIDALSTSLAEQMRAERRERIATAALQGLLANSSRCDQSRDFAGFAINFADALIAKLDEEPQP